ncbi:GntR family transcriptional regulator [Rhizobium vallis]|uniref:GntR family transcriptional regulator n=1 Tax=Rhizobium vallis TaxID=634290 RepID=A0A3S0QP40_9HYPH|nr:GntR family transcriptional regulator [Rhizobium vallis]RUM24140.1 GntR family transcriptional regulator [Rhizobium vallis]
MTQVKLPKIQKMPADARALSVLRSQIVDGSIAPGSRLTEIQLSEEMGLSRATVRTALHQLGKEGLVKLVPYTGWTVIELTPTDIWELYTLRGAVERLAAQLAATKSDEKSVAAIAASFETLRRECEIGKPTSIAEADFAFHKSIVNAASHERLVMQYELIEQQIRVYIHSSDALISDPIEIVAQHEPILRAIRDGNPSLAGELSERHNLVEGEKLTSSM